MKRREFKTIFCGGSGTGGGIFARGVCDSADCSSGTLDIDVSHMSNCNDIPDAYGTVVTAVDVDGIMTPFTATELTGASVRIGYYYDVDTCTGQWEIWSIVGVDQCKGSA